MIRLLEKFEFFWGCGAAGSALAWHARGQGFKSPQLHQVLVGSPKLLLITAPRTNISF